jgi:hypothetical protein
MVATPIIVDADIERITPWKYPDEKETYEFDFSSRISTGITISSKSATIVKVSDTSVDVSTLITASTISGTSVMVTVDGGTDKEDYKITVIATLSDGRKPELVAVLPVSKKWKAA